MTYREIQDDVIKRYRVTINTPSTCRGRMHAHIRERKVCKWCSKNSVVSTFDLFHEIGHIETTKSTMRRAEEEYHATLWALDRCREYGVKIPRKVWARYNDYIQREKDRGIRRGGNGYPAMSLPEDSIEGA